MIALAGLIARDERKRKHAMHAAVVVALLGFPGSMRGLLQIGDVFDGIAVRPAAVVADRLGRADAWPHRDGRPYVNVLPGSTAIVQTFDAEIGSSVAVNSSA